MGTEATPPPSDDLDLKRLIKFLIEIQFVKTLVPDPGGDPASGRSESVAPQNPRSRRKRRSRPAPPLSIRWWCDQTTYARSTLYSAIGRGFLKANKPEGSSYRIQPEDFLTWHEAAVSPAGINGAINPAPSLRSPKKEAPPSFRHVRWRQLPDGPPREGDDS